jgi:hypothetical protein
MIPFKKYLNKEDTTTGSVVGTGDDSDTVIVRKKYDKKSKRKDQIAVLKRLMAACNKKY